MDEIGVNICNKKKNIFHPNIMNRYRALLNNVYPPFIRLLIHVLQTKRFGVTCGTIELIEVTSSHGNEKGDRFNITIPYARQTLHWTVMFDATHPEIGPDFEFNDKTFFIDPDTEMLEEFVPSLVGWNIANEDCLLNVLSEFLLCYKLHQRKQLGERLDMEYSTLVGQTEISDEDVEILLLPDTLDPNEAQFFIKITTDFSKLPCKNGESDQIAVMLLVTFRGANWHCIIPQIHFSSGLNDALGSINNLHIPPFPSSKTLMDYVPEIKRIIDAKVNAVVINHEMKKRYVETFLCIQGESIIEYDTNDFSYFVMLLEHRDFHVLIHISLSPTFPTTPPKITLQSVYNFDGRDSDLYKKILNIPYSPRWDAKTMITKALFHIINEELEPFKMKSTQSRY